MRTSKTITVLSLVFFLGLHWAVLQSVAWVTMLAAYTGQDGFLMAVSKTFDGQHPCDLCLVIREATSEGDQQDTASVVSATHLDWILDTPAAVYVPPEPERPQTLPSGSELGIPSIQPPTPPPRPSSAAV